MNFDWFINSNLEVFKQFLCMQIIVRFIRNVGGRGLLIRFGCGLFARFFFIHSCTRQNKFHLDSQACVSSARNEFYSLLFMVNKFHEKANVYF